MITNTERMRNRAAATSRKSLTTIAWVWLWTKVNHLRCGSGFRLGTPAVRYVCTLRGDTWTPTFGFNSLAMRSSPQVGLSAAIFRINLWTSLGNLHIYQRIAPLEHSAQDRHHPQGGIVGPSWPDLPLLEERQLLPEEEVLRCQCETGPTEEEHKLTRVDQHNAKGTEEVSKAQGAAG